VRCVKNRVASSAHGSTHSGPEDACSVARGNARQHGECTLHCTPCTPHLNLTTRGPPSPSTLFLKEHFTHLRGHYVGTPRRRRGGRRHRPAFATRRRRETRGRRRPGRPGTRRVGEGRTFRSFGFVLDEVGSTRLWVRLNFGGDGWIYSLQLRRDAEAPNAGKKHFAFF
jgi:hypothetical protein